MLRLVTTERFPSRDAVFQKTEPLQFSSLAYDTLVTLAAAPGPDGLRLLPDLALALPSPRHLGTEYVFRLRRGIRYSDGARLRPSDFRRAIERLFRIHSPAPTTTRASWARRRACDPPGNAT
jgi:ABC-type transport system substrate-binding protein